MREDQEAYLKGRRDKRFMELQRAVGVKAGANNAANQRADAWHLYCAEYEKASHFLTVDYRMIRHLQSHRSTTPKLKVVTPRELLTDLRQTRNIRWFDDAGFLLERLILRFRPTPPAHGAEQLVVFGETLERAGYYDPWNT
jgi:hypothetical protein